MQSICIVLLSNLKLIYNISNTQKINHANGNHTHNNCQLSKLKHLLIHPHPTISFKADDCSAMRNKSPFCKITISTWIAKYFILGSDNSTREVPTRLGPVSCSHLARVSPKLLPRYGSDAHVQMNSSPKPLPNRHSFNANVQSNAKKQLPNHHSAFICFSASTMDMGQNLHPIRNESRY